MKKILFAVLFITLGWAFQSCNSTKSTATTSSKPTSTTTKPVEKTSEKPVEDEYIGETEKNTLVNFIKTDKLMAIVNKAKKEKKVVFLDFYATWCAPCRLMDQSVFSDGDVADYMNTNCVNMKIDAEKGDGVALKIQFNVNTYPTYIFIDGNTDEVFRKEGSLSIEDFKKFMKNGVWKIKSASGNP